MEAVEGTQNRNLAVEGIKERYLLACSARSLTQPMKALPSSLSPLTSNINQESAPTGQGDRAPEVLMDVGRRQTTIILSMSLTVFAKISLSTGFLV